MNLLWWLLLPLVLLWGHSPWGGKKQQTSAYQYICCTWFHVQYVILYIYDCQVTGVGRPPTVCSLCSYSASYYSCLSLFLMLYLSHFVWQSFYFIYFPFLYMLSDFTFLCLLHFFVACTFAYFYFVFLLTSCSSLDPFVSLYLFIAVLHFYLTITHLISFSKFSPSHLFCILTTRPCAVSMLPGLRGQLCSHQHCFILLCHRREVLAPRLRYGDDHNLIHFLHVYLWWSHEDSEELTYSQVTAGGGQMLLIV